MRQLCCLILFGCLIQFWGLSAQTVIDENNPPDSVLVGIGPDSTAYFAQSFLADITVLQEFGVWLRQEFPQGAVQLQLVPADSHNLPDFGNSLYSGADIFPPDSILAFESDSGLNIPLVLGQRYFVVIDGENSGGMFGWSAAGLSSTFTDTNDPLILSRDQGNTWDTLNRPLSIFVAGLPCDYPVRIAPRDTMICVEGSATLDAGTDFLGYAWSNGGRTQTITVNSAGIYAVTVTDTTGCVSTDSISVSLHPVPDPALPPLFEVCDGQSAFISVSNTFASYLWNVGSSIPFITPSNPGTYWVDVVDFNGCVGSDTTELQILPTPMVSLGPDTNLCEGELLQVNAGAGFSGYLWSTGATTPSVLVTQDDTLWVSVTDSSGCPGQSDTLGVNFHPFPLQPTITQLGDLLRSSFADNYQWLLNGDSLAGETNQTLEIMGPGSYMVIVESQFGCESNSAPFEILPSGTIEAIIPNAFSPNGDGVNDVFFIEGIDTYPGNVFSVFNRYGEEVFRKTDYNNDWDGSGPGGNGLPDGDYFYILDLNDGNAPVQGALLIHR